MRTSKGSGDGFRAAYDAALQAWSRSADPIEVPTPFGVTRVNACGPVEGPALVLLPGGGATSTAWGSTVAQLDPGRRALAVDVMGDVGRSAPGGQPIRGPDDHAAWLEATLDALELGTVDLCAHSYGGWLALNFALRRPDRVRRLALVAPSSCFAGLRTTYLVRAAPMLVRPTPAGTRAFLTWEAGARKLDERWLAVAALGSQMPTAPLVRPKRPSAELLRSLRIPTLIVLAEHDRSHDNQRVASHALELLPDVQMCTLPGATHHSTPIAEGPALANVLEEFLSA